jgi:heptosyltransferase-1
MDRASVREPLAALFYDRTHPVPRALHAVERNRPPDRRFPRYPSQSASTMACARRRRCGARPAGSYSVLLTMTSRADKLWPEARWIELGRALGASGRAAVGNAEERGRAERIAAARARRWFRTG